MSNHALTAENLLASLPAVLQQDENMRAIASSIADILAGRMQEIAAAELYPRIEELPEDLLDLIAYDFKIDWWDADYTLEEKRAILKDSWRVHRMLGTTAAVVTAISAIYPDTQVSEWWQYNGDPYHFKLLIDATYQGVDPAMHARVLSKVNYYKNLRSVLDEVEYYDAGGTATAYAAATFIGCEIVDGCATVN